MSRKQSLSRRDFLKGSLVATAGVVGFPTIIPSQALGADGFVAPSNRLVMGTIGHGGMGNGDMHSLMQFPYVQVVAVCDVDAGRRDAARRDVNNYYTDKRGAKWEGCAEYNDFRELLAREDIDIVTNATPDHWHAPILIAAVKAGKDVYCQKPLSLTIYEGQRMVEETHRYGRVVQVGTQQRSDTRFRQACELVRNGRIGQLERVVCALPNAPRIGPQEPMQIPEQLDYEMWLGQAPWAPYTQKRCHWNFRYIYDYSGGMMTDWGAHHADIAQWGMGTEDTGPVYIEGRGDHPTEGLFNVASSFEVNAEYANGVKLKLVTEGGEYINGVYFYGTDGMIFVSRAEIKSDPIEILHSEIGPNETHLYVSNDHYGNFLDCVQTRSVPICPIEVGHRSVSVCHLANISMRLGRGLKWDPKREQFVDAPDADAMLSRAMRAPWQV